MFNQGFKPIGLFTEMDIKSLSAKEAEVRDLLYRPGCILMSVGRPGPEAFKGCNEILVAATKGLLVGEDESGYTLLKRQTVKLGCVCRNCTFYLLQ